MRNWDYRALQLMECIGGENLVATSQSIVRNVVSIVDQKQLHYVCKFAKMETELYYKVSLRYREGFYHNRGPHS